MSAMFFLKSMAYVWLLWAGQGVTPPYVEQGDAVEARFRVHRDNLENFFDSLRGSVARRAPELLSEFQDPPPEPLVYGYGLLPRIVEEYPLETDTPISSFSYSWPITARYIEGEVEKLRQLEEHFNQTAGAVTHGVIQQFIRQYLSLVRNQRTIDGYIQYNRFWQRAIAIDRPQFDQMTRLYERMLSGDPATAEGIQDVLGTPDVPSFVRVDRNAPDAFVLRVPVYTDIEDVPFLQSAEKAIEGMWTVDDVDGSFTLDVEFRRVSVSELYQGGDVPVSGDPLDVQRHSSRFPKDGAVLTTGAEATHGFVGRYVALGPGDLSARTLAHEFGHVLGFHDGYIRGYRDLGELGFEILELTSAFDDIMSAPREGRVLATHFKLIINAVP